jgi:hypothetical protein
MLAVLAAAGFAERAFWRAQRVLTSSARQVSSANEFAFRVEQLGGVRREARFHRVVSSGGFHSAVAFSGGLFVCGRSSLTDTGRMDRLSKPGTWARTFRLPR